MKKLKVDISFYKKLWVIVFPIIIQNLVASAVSSADVIMLNFVGQESLAAASIAVQYANVVSCVFFGMGTGATMLCAQYWGKGDKDSIEKVEGIALRISMAVGALFAILAASIPALLMKIFTNDEALISLGAGYLRIVSVMYFTWSISEVYISVLRSIGRVKVATVLSSVPLALNILLNAVFIFGLLGAPKMGINGVALATSVARVVQLILCFVVSARSSDIKLKISMIFVKSKLLWHDFLVMAIPAVLNDVIWGLAYSMYTVIMGHMGSYIVAANSIVSVARNFGTVVGFAIAGATGIILGQLLGANKFEEAKQSAHRLVILSAVTGLVGGVIIFAFKPLILQFAARSLDAAGLDLLSFMLLIQTYYCMGQTVNTAIIVGVFRAGGDSRFGLIIDSVDMWLYAVPLGLLAAFVFKFPVKLVYFLLLTDEFVKWPWVFKKYFGYSWLKNITRDNV
ncbi:MAG: MATE family efflux transporter [Lachnospiraceae bacterium]|nr:MATE family efflux transporter [Lachnospiraceae bacterium]